MTVLPGHSNNSINALQPGPKYCQVPGFKICCFKSGVSTKIIVLISETKKTTLLKLKYLVQIFVQISHRLFQDSACVHPEFLHRHQGSGITLLHFTSFQADLIWTVSHLGSTCPGCLESRGITYIKCSLLEGMWSKVSIILTAH